MELPDSLGDIAWATHSTRQEGDSYTAVVAIGRLGKPVSKTIELPLANNADVDVVASGGLVAIVGHAPWGSDAASVVRIFDVDGAEVGSTSVASRIQQFQTVLDGAGGYLYLPLVQPGRSVEIHRYRIDGSGRTKVITLDERFVEEGIPLNHFGSVVASDGDLVTFACADDECRLWETPPGGTPSSPRTIDVPKLCSVVAASPDVLVAYDDAMCYIDVAPMVFPLRTIDLADGRHRLIATETHDVLARRLVLIDGQGSVIAARRADDWSTTDIISLDPTTGEERVLLGDLKNVTGDTHGFYGVSDTILPGAWVLVAPWFEAKGTMPGYLLDAATGEVIELPPGTVTWS